MELDHALIIEFTSKGWESIIGKHGKTTLPEKEWTDSKISTMMKLSFEVTESSSTRSMWRDWRMEYSMPMR